MTIAHDTTGFGRCAACGALTEVFALSCWCKACLDERWRLLGAESDDINEWLFGDANDDDV